MTESLVDLHTHSVFSDGTKTPCELVKAAVDIGLKAIALTDHDTIDGLDEAVKAGRQYGMEVIPGIELAAYYNSPLETEIHIVGLFIDYTSKTLLAKTKEIQAERRERNIKMIKRLNDIGFDITYNELLEITGGRELFSRAHYAALMLKKGYVETKKEAFSRYISYGKPGYVSRRLPTPKECIEIIRESGGVSVLAHPTLYQMNYGQIRKMAQELKLMGLCGIESRYSTYNHEQQREITKIAHELSLKESGGSDYHGLSKPDIQIGTGRGNLLVPYSFLTELKSAKPDCQKI